MNDSITADLLALRDEAYADFHAKLVPDIPRERIIGIRMPRLREYAKTLAKDREAARRFLDAMPYRYTEEYTLHGIIVSAIRDFDEAMAECERFLPHIDNWATCDTFAPKSFARHRDEVYAKCLEWLASERTYTVRFAVVTAIQHFLGDDFRPELLERLATLRTDEYYINMAVAWFYSVALVKQWDATIPVIESGWLDHWVHNKSIAKATESFRVPQERKDYLRTLRRRKEEGSEKEVERIVENR